MTLRTSARNLLSFAAWAGVVPPPSTLRPHGVSAMTLVKNEEDWVETSVLSVLDYVDEVLVADNDSIDSTLQILKRLAASYPRKIRLLDLGNLDFVPAINAMIGETRYRWLLRWHGDFVARTSGNLSVQKLFEHIGRLSAARHYCIALAGVALDGDLEHQFEDRVDDPENFLYTYSPWLHYRLAGRWEELHVPWFYAKLTWEDLHYFHLRSVKSGERLLQKVYQGRWFQARGSGRNISLAEFVRERALEELGTADIPEAAKRFVVEHFRHVVPFSQELCGEYPDILVPALGHPPFRLTIEDGRVVGRVELDRFRPAVQPRG